MRLGREELLAKPDSLHCLWSLYNHKKHAEYYDLSRHPRKLLVEQKNITLYFINFRRRKGTIYLSNNYSRVDTHTSNIHDNLDEDLDLEEEALERNCKRGRTNVCILLFKFTISLLY